MINPYASTYLIATRMELNSPVLRDAPAPTQKKPRRPWRLFRRNRPGVSEI